MSARSTRKSSVLVALLVILALLLPMSGPSSAAPRAETARSSSIMFIENVGQFAEAARFQVRGGTGTMWLADDSIWITVLEPDDGAEKLADAEPTPRKGVNVRISFPGANPHVSLEPFHRLDTHVSYFIGNDPSHWHSDVPVWGGVKYRNLYPGVDLILGETQDGSGWRFDVHRGATTPRGPFEVEGLPDARHPDGRQLLTTALGPRATADNPGQLYYGTYFGGDGPWGDTGTDVAVDGTGAIYLAGHTGSSDFPTTPGAFDSSIANIDAFVAKLMPNGNGTTDLIYSTLIGGVHDFHDYAYAIGVDASGRAHITGETSSYDFPNTHCTADGCLCPYRGTGIGGGGPSDAFLTTLNPAGTGLLNSTFIGGAYSDYATDLVYQGGYLYLVGTTTSADFPVSLNTTTTDEFVSSFDEPRVSVLPGRCGSGCQ